VVIMPEVTLKEPAMLRLPILMVCLVLSACGGSDGEIIAASGDATPAPTKVTLQLNWFPETEHGGYFHAAVSGIYRDAGIDITIVDGGPNTPVETQIGIGRAHFGIANADRILAVRANDLPIVGLMAPYQISPRCIVVHEESPYHTLADIKDTTLIVNTTQPFYLYMKHRYKLDGVTTLPYRGGPGIFMANPGYAIQGYITSEPIVFAKQGVKTRSMLLADAGYSAYTSVLITSEELAKTQPDLCRRMVKASQKAWLAYFADPAAANAEIRKRNPEMDADVLTKSTAMLPAMMTTGDAETTFGNMTLGRWESLAKQLVECGVLEKLPANVNAAFTTEFLQ
jgi:NitT/TauT family transport system substrate-binding protein